MYASKFIVVYRSIPTSNRNPLQGSSEESWLYIVLFLHQTATEMSNWTYNICCISFYSYIKPQPSGETANYASGCISFYSYIKPQPSCSCLSRWYVVYRSIPTSNRNVKPGRIYPIRLYIVLFLHQTATAKGNSDIALRCISFYSYIKPQRMRVQRRQQESCISFYSYIKPQPLSYLFVW